MDNNVLKITPEYIEGMKEILNNPAKYNFDYIPFKECFIVAYKVTASDVLAKQYLSYLNNRALNKFIVYILLQDSFGFGDGKDEKGNLGYKLMLNPKITAQAIKEILTQDVF